MHDLGESLQEIRRIGSAALLLTNDDFVATMVAVSFAAGLNLYATTATLGLLARANLLTLPPQLGLLADDWVIGVSLVLFAIEFFADKIPVFDLIWNVVQTFVRVPAAALLAWAAATPLSPTAQLLAAVAAAGIAFVAHSGKLAMRGAASSSPEPFSNILLSLIEDAVAIGLTWFASEYPYLAAAIALVLLVITVLLIRWAWKLTKAAGRRVRDWLIPSNGPARSSV